MNVETIPKSENLVPALDCVKYTIGCHFLAEMTASQRDVSREVFFVFLEVLCERLDGPIHCKILKELSEIRHNPDKQSLKSVALRLLSVACIDNTKSYFSSFCALVDNYFDSEAAPSDTLELDLLRQLHGKLFQALRAALIERRELEGKLECLEPQRQQLMRGMKEVQETLGEVVELPRQKSKHIVSAERNRLMITNDLMHLIGVLNREASRCARAKQNT